MIVCFMGRVTVTIYNHYNNEWEQTCMCVCEDGAGVSEWHHFLCVSGAQVDQSVFEELIRERLPDLAEHVPDVSSLASVSLTWFLTLFLSVLPFRSALCVLDCFFYHGIRTIFQISLAALEANAAELCTCTDDGQALMILNRWSILSWVWISVQTEKWNAGLMSRQWQIVKLIINIPWMWQFVVMTWHPWSLCHVICDMCCVCAVF